MTIRGTWTQLIAVSQHRPTDQRALKYGLRGCVSFNFEPGQLNMRSSGSTILRNNRRKTWEADVDGPRRRTYLGMAAVRWYSDGVGSSGEESFEILGDCAASGVKVA
jgi:hypothetical protein